MEDLHVRYVLSGRHHIAYGIEGIADSSLGSCPADVMYMGSGFIPFTMYRDYPPFASVLDRLGSFARVILSDRRGVGSSDPINKEQPGTPAEVAGDLAAILVAAGSRGAAVIAEGLAVPSAVELAVRFPKLVSHLILFNGFAKQTRSDDYPLGIDVASGEAVVKDILDGSDVSGLVEHLNPDVPEGDMFFRFASRGGSIGASRGSAEAIYQSLGDIDVRDGLGRIKAPTLVIHRRDTRFYSMEQGKYLADHIDGAEFLELVGTNQLVYLGETE
ncbi:MAG: alpha/beta fold hydrolase, partial [Acidimicrobiales bacterium]